MRKIYSRTLIFLLSIPFYCGHSAAQTRVWWPIEVQCPEAPVRADEPVTLRAVFPENAPIGDYSFSWSVSRGTISGITVEGFVGSSTLQANLEKSSREGKGGPEYPGARSTGSCRVSVEDPKPVLYEKLPTIGNCEDLLSRLDGFFIELNNNPTNRGYIVVQSDPERQGHEAREQQVRAWIKVRNFDRERITLVRGIRAKNATTEMWLVPPGADTTSLIRGGTEVRTDTANPGGQTPYIFAKQFIGGIDGCDGNLFDLEDYAKVIKTRPGSRGNVVIGRSSRSEFRSEERGIRAALKQHGISSKRIATFFKQVKPGAAAEFIELWVIPLRAPK